MKQLPLDFEREAPAMAEGVTTFLPGARVRVVASAPTHARRVGVVVALCRFPFRDHRRVRFDDDVPETKSALIDERDLRRPKPSQRPRVEGGASPPHPRECVTCGFAPCLCDQQ